MESNSNPVLAVNIAILPNTRWLEWSEAVNALLPASEKNIQFGNHCVPHVTLSMGCIAYADLPKLVEQLPEISEDFRLTPAGLSSHPRPDGFTWWLDVEYSEAFKALQEQVEAAIAPFRKHPVEASHFTDPEVVDDRAVDYVSTFAEKNYAPHVTLGFGEALPVLPSMPSTSKARLEVWHMGPHCTCSGRLWAAIS